jgi:transcriptional regulator with XRE-family HTH domain
VPQHNELIRAARMRVESPNSPRLPMTRQELAEAVNAHVFRAANERSSVDANHVGKWERGETRWPTVRYRAALRAVLNVATDAELGFRKPQRATVDNVDRKTFIRATLGAGAGVVLAHTPLTPPPDGGLAEVLSGPTMYYRRMESAVASDQLGPAVDAHLSLATRLVRERLRTSAGFCVLSEIAGLAAWLAADRGDNATARRRYKEAIVHAQRTHHPLLISYMTASFGQFAVEASNPRAGLSMLNRASAQLDATAPDTARAWMASLFAVAHASLGDRAATTGALLEAEKLANRQRHEPQWPWVFAFDAAKVAQYQAAALSRIGDVRAARVAYAAAGPALTAAKPRALAQVEHAHVVARAGDVAGGCALAVEALSVGRAYRSERITNRVRDFRTTFPVRSAEAETLDAALVALYEGGRS